MAFEDEAWDGCDARLAVGCRRGRSAKGRGTGVGGLGSPTASISD